MIGLLATGDELIEGDVINTNGPSIARQLSEAKFMLGMRMTCRDVENDIEACLRYLAERHEVVIITGGLGPTSDDITRNALADFVGQPLEFDENSWQAICDRLRVHGLKPNEANRQQAYFPKGAEIFPNMHGTAAGCKVVYNNKLIYMLPGPPRECIPMFENFALTDVESKLEKLSTVRMRWLLFGVSEGEVAAELDGVANNYHCKTGYRWHYPYIEFKVDVDESEDVEAVRSALTDVVKNYELIAGEVRPASEVLREKLLGMHTPLCIDDRATGGVLEGLLRQLDTAERVMFGEEHCVGSAFLIRVTGMEAHWQQTDDKDTNVRVEVLRPAGNEQNSWVNATHFELNIPRRHGRITHQAAEWVCAVIYKWLESR